MSKSKKITFDKLKYLLSILSVYHVDTLEYKYITDTIKLLEYYYVSKYNERLHKLLIWRMRKISSKVIRYWSIGNIQ